MGNLVFNGDFRIWGNGVGNNALPTGWYRAAAGGGTLPSIERASDSKAPAGYAVRMTRNDYNAFLGQNIAMSTGRPLGWFVGKKLTYGALIKWSAPDVNLFANATFSDGVLETHTDMHRGFNEYRLCVGSHIVQNNPTQMILNALTVKRSDFQPGVVSADILWAGVFLGDVALADYVESIWGHRVSSLSFAAGPDENISAGQTRYIGPSGMDGQEDYVSQPMPFDGVIRNLRVRSGAPPGIGESITFTLRSDGVDMGMTISITGANQGAANTGVDIYIPKGANISLKAASSVGAASANLRASLEIEHIPSFNY